MYYGRENQLACTNQIYKDVSNEISFLISDSLFTKGKIKCLHCSCDIPPLPN